jgi:hypothetical protein
MHETDFCIGMAVVKMPVTSSVKRPPDKGSNSIAYSPPTQSRSVVKIAVTSFATREVAGSKSRPAFMRRLAQRIEHYPAGLPAGVSAIACSRIVFP